MTKLGNTLESSRSLIGLGSDRPGAGKTTAERYLSAEGFRPVRIGDAVKAEVDRMTQVHDISYSEEQKELFRPLLAAWTEFRIRHDGPDYWLSSVLRRTGANRVVVSDLRYPNELQWLRSAGGICIFIRRRSVEPSSLSTEGLLRESDFDYVVENSQDDGGRYMINQIVQILQLESSGRQRGTRR